MSARPFYQSPLTGDSPYHIAYSVNKASFDPHWHSEIEMLFVASGSIVVSIDGLTMPVGKGQAAFVSSAEIHSLDKVEAGSRILVVELGYKLLGAGFSLFFGRTFEDKVVALENYPRLENIVSDIISLCSAGSGDREIARTANEFRTRSLLCAFAAEILTSLRTRELGERPRRLRDDMLSMQQTLDYIDHNYSEPLDVMRAAELSGYEKTRFCQLFKRAIGVSFHKYLNSRRIEAAKEMLTSSELSIQIIASDTGFTESKTFSRVFRASEGMTPSEYRELMANAAGNVNKKI